jgi:hypothetical protein
VDVRPCSGRCSAQAVRRHGPVDVTALVAQMLQMGDEGHNRNRAGTLMLLRELLPDLLSLDAPSSDLAEVTRFVGGNDHFFLNLVMPACKLATDAAADVPARRWSSRWRATAPTSASRPPARATAGSPPGAARRRAVPRRLRPDDANPDIGDSAITETGGLGGLRDGAAPAIVRLVGGDAAYALRTTARMYEITLAESRAYACPVLDFRGHADRHRRAAGRAHRHPAADQHRAWRAASPAPARSARGWSPRRRSASRRRSRRWRRPAPPL